MEIFKLKPIGKDSLWGGTKLKEKYGKDIDLYPLAETWECSTHPSGQNIIENGKFKGKKLSYVLKKNPEFLGKKYKKLKQLPILVKFIDANKDLSVQVHPNDRYAKKYEKQKGKTEMWYVVEAEKGAKLIYGFEHPVTDKILKDAVQTGEIEKHLHYEPVQAGDSFYMPAGTVHGIGKGILIAEIQQSSDVTYRVYDYNRVDKNGKQRELHFDKALKVMNKYPMSEKLIRHKLIHYFPNLSIQELINCEFFQVNKICLNGTFEHYIGKLSFENILCIDGNGQIETSSSKIEFRKGDSLFIPANCGNVLITGKCIFLSSKC